MARQLLFDRIDDRISRDREDGDSAYFFALTLKLEYLTKIVVSGMIACIGKDKDADRRRYSLEHELVRADSLGDWTKALNMALVGTPSKFMIPEADGLKKDLTDRVGPGDWRYEAVAGLNKAAMAIGAETMLGKKTTLQQFFRIGSQLRNRSRGHGAPTIGQRSRSCPYLDSSLNAVTKNLKIFHLPWIYLHRNLSGKYRVLPLLNNPAPFEYLKKTRNKRFPNGVFFSLNDPAHPVRVPLIFIDLDLADITLPNGNYKYTEPKFETLSYVTNEVDRRDGSAWSDPPLPTVFNGFPFGAVVFDYPKGKNVLHLAMDELRKRDDLHEIGIDPERPGRPLIRDDGGAVWNVLVFAGTDDWRASPHLTLGVGTEYVSAMTTLPNKALAKYRQPLTALGEQGFRSMAGKVLENMRPLLADCPGMEPLLRVHHRRQPSPSERPQMVDATDMYLQTCIDTAESQSQWIEALLNRKSKPEVQIGARFPYRTCKKAIAKTRSLDFVARAWIACKPYIDVLFGSADARGAP